MLVLLLQPCLHDRVHSQLPIGLAGYKAYEPSCWLRKHLYLVMTNLGITEEVGDADLDRMWEPLSI